LVTEGSKTALYRSKHDRKFAGVAAGLARHLNVDPTIVRVAFVVLSFINGIGLIAYLAGWLLMPEEGENGSIAESAVRKLRGHQSAGDSTWAWVAVLGIGAIIVFANMSSWSWSPGGIFWAVALVVGGIWLYRQDAESRTETTVVASPGTPVSPLSPGAPVSPLSQDSPVSPLSQDSPVSAASPEGTTMTLPAGNPAVTEKVRPFRPARIRPPRSRLGRYTVAAGLVVLGGAAALSNNGSLNLNPVQYLGLGLTVIGGGLLIGSLWGRSRTLVFLGLLTLPFLFVASLLSTWSHVPWTAGTGDRSYTPGSAASVAKPYELVAGTMNIDLTQMSWGSEPVKVKAGVTFGQINVDVPRGVNVVAHTHTDIGSVTLFEANRSGTNVDLSTNESSIDQPTLTLDLKAFMGDVEVHRAAAQARSSK
jgi:phage shock protein PspC (stress-responsive transcriptional regulator)